MIICHLAAATIYLTGMTWVSRMQHQQDIDAELRAMCNTTPGKV